MKCRPIKPLWPHSATPIVACTSKTAAVLLAYHASCPGQTLSVNVDLKPTVPTKTTQDVTSR